MIVFFKVKNFKSIKDELTLSFAASSISELTDSNVHQKGRDNLLRSSLLYGHNASGKSKILDALVFCRWFVLNSATETNSKNEIGVEPFELSALTEEMPSKFEICFYVGTVKYRYGFEATEKRVTKEWLLESKKLKEYPLFLRIESDIQIDEKRFLEAKGLEKRTRQNVLFLSVCSQWNVSKAEKITEWFDDIYTVHGLMDEDFRSLSIELLKNKKFSEMVLSFIKKADLGIQGIDVLDIPIPVEDIIENVPEELKDTFRDKFKERKEKAIIVLHKKYDKNNKEVGVTPFLLDKHESEGTKKYFNLIGVFVDAILGGKLVVIDEFDARFHTLLSKSILKLFNSNDIKSEAQLLVAGHDTALLDKRILRRDQICFVEKDSFGATQFTSLVEYKPRKDSPIDKNYLDGRYGGIPMISDLEEIFK